MSGIVPLRAITKGCCAARLFFRGLRIAAGKEDPSEHFGCQTCGQAYHYDARGWTPVSAADDLKAMVAEDPRGHLED